MIEESAKPEQGALPALSLGPQRTLASLILGNGLTLVTLIALVLAGGEVYYRFIFDSTDSFGITRVCQRWYQRHYAANNVGVRDDINYARERIPGLQRITFLGDSFTVGHGIASVDDRFANRIRRSHPAAWEVRVLAATGDDTGAEIESLRSSVQDGYQPGVVVLVYVLNDISDLVPEWGRITDRIYSQQGSEPWPVRHSYFINLLYYRLKAARDPDIADYYAFVHGAYAGPVWPLQQQRLRRLKDLCAAKGAPLLVVTFPFLHALGPHYAYADVHRQLDVFWEGEGVPCLDLLPVYAPYRPQDLVVGRFDAHPNVFAHKVAADAIGAFVAHHLSGSF